MSEKLHKCRPPHIGWWHIPQYNAWSWWDGEQWSMLALDDEGVLMAAWAATVKTDKNRIWTDYYPPNARVPRIDPRKK